MTPFTWSLDKSFSVNLWFCWFLPRDRSVTLVKQKRKKFKNFPYRIQILQTWLHGMTKYLGRFHSTQKFSARLSVFYGSRFLTFYGRNPSNKKTFLKTFFANLLPTFFSTFWHISPSYRSNNKFATSKNKTFLPIWCLHTTCQS